MYNMYNDQLKIDFNNNNFRATLCDFLHGPAFFVCPQCPSNELHFATYKYFIIEPFTNHKFNNANFFHASQTVHYVVIFRFVTFIQNPPSPIINLTELNFANTHNLWIWCERETAYNNLDSFYRFPIVLPIDLIIMNGIRSSRQRVHISNL